MKTVKAGEESSGSEKDENEMVNGVSKNLLLSEKDENGTNQEILESAERTNEMVNNINKLPFISEEGVNNISQDSSTLNQDRNKKLNCETVQDTSLSAGLEERRREFERPINALESCSDNELGNGVDVDDEGIRFEDIYVPPPPAASFQAHKDGSRLIITHIVNENFKSYANVQKLGPFHKYFTAIIGPNGSGKSNVIDSMLFVFGYRANRLRSRKISSLIHESPNHPKVTSCTVTVHFALMIDEPEDLHEYKIKPDSEFYISRTAFIDNTSYYTINGKRVHFKEVGKLLRTHGIDLDHNRFLILQGEVEQISLMKPRAENEHEVGMLEYLEDIIGSSRFKEPINELVKRVEVQTEIRDEKWNRCKIARNELEDLKSPMEAALKYVELENAIIALNHKMLQKKIFLTEKENAEEKKIVDDLENKIVQLQRELKEKRKVIKEEESSKKVKSVKLEKIASLKENAKAAFEAKKLKDVALQQTIENVNKKRKDIVKALTAEEEKRNKLEKLPEKNIKTIAELNALETKLEEERQQTEEMHAKIMETLAQDTEALQDEKENLQSELVNLKKIVDRTKSKHDMAKTELNIYRSQEENEKNKLNELKKRLEDIQIGLSEKEKEMNNISISIPQHENNLKNFRAKLKTLKEEEIALTEKCRKHQLQMEEKRVAMHSHRGRGKVLDSLMQLKLEGKLPGIYGRMGNLGAVDEKYDVAISTACGPLDNIVVDTVDTATECIEFLKRNNIGSATFVALEKQERFREVIARPFRAPENVPRLFDLIKVADERIRTVFYYALQDTLVADDLDQAMRIAYGETRYRVVTLNGELIEIAGTMSGGGNQIFKGRMGQKIERQTEMISPKELEEMEKKLDDVVARLRDIRNEIVQVEDKIRQSEREVQALGQQKNKLDIELQSFNSQEPMIKNQIKNQETKYKEAALDEIKLADLNRVVEESEKEYKQALDNADVVEKQVNKLHEEIIAKTKGRLDAVQKKLDEIVDKIDKARKEKTRLKVAITTAERNVKKCEEKIENMKQEREECSEKMTRCAEEIKENEAEAQKTLEEFQKYEEELQKLIKESSESKIKMERLLEEESELKKKQIDLNEEVSNAKSEYEETQNKINVDKKKLQLLKLIEEPLNENKIELHELTEEELENININDVMEEIKSKEISLPKIRPNLGVIQEYIKKRNIYLDRQKDLEEATNKRNKTRTALEEFKACRLKEFMKGFSIISEKVKECYQMLAEGGDAELELANTMDPFLDGIRFTVRPPRKSWKEIQYLSGGEKTLSSLSLIFALHYYKATPLYFMDEIDAALDWRNTTIVGVYLKMQTKNAQFIVVSLRENMFELADKVVGIFKTNNCTKSVSIIPSKYNLIDNQNNIT